MEQVLAAYQRPYDPAFPVVCFDESPQQLIKEKREPFFDAKGTKHTDYEYIREGVADIFMICEPLGGRREVRIEDNHHRFTYAKTLAYIVEDMFPKAKKITLIEDNLSAHKISALYEVFEPKKSCSIFILIGFLLFGLFKAYQFYRYKQEEQRRAPYYENLVDTSSPTVEVLRPRIPSS